MTEELPQCLYMSASRQGKVCSIVPSVLLLVAGPVWGATKLFGATTLFGVAGIIWVGSFLWYTVEWIRSGTCRFLCNRKQEMNVYGYVHQLRATKPVVKFSVVCWHMETRTRTEWHEDEEGVRYKTTETWEEKVISHSRTEYYAFTRWKDNTAPLPSLGGCEMTKLYLSVEYGFLDDAAKHQYDAAKQRFKDRTPSDAEMEFSTERWVPGFKNRTLCYVDEAGPPAWVNGLCFMLASLLFLTVPYRMALDRRVAEHGHTIRKLFGT